MIVLGDLNANLGACGGPLATNTPSEQGKILLQYLHKWNYVSVHLHNCNMSPTYTYTSEAHGTSGTIDHILCPELSYLAFQIVRHLYMTHSISLTMIPSMLAFLAHWK